MRESDVELLLIIGVCCVIVYCGKCVLVLYSNRLR
jgi:hypothetical protein